MLVAYLDEFGHVGPYFTDEVRSRPAFGYAGFVIPVENVREFGGYFEFIKERLLGWEIKRANAHPRRWEKKGASLLTENNMTKYGKREITPALERLFKKLQRLGGQVVYYGCEKEHGATPEETSSDRSRHMLINSVRKLAHIADERDEGIMIFLDSVDTTPRLEAVSALGGFIYTAKEEELKRVVEVPMQLDSKHYGNVQFADWICGLMGRVTDHHLAARKNAAWSPQLFKKLVYQSQRAHPNSYIRTGHKGTARDHLHTADLARSDSWSSLPPKETARKPAAPQPQAKRPKVDRPFVQSIAESNPHVVAILQAIAKA